VLSFGGAGRWRHGLVGAADRFNIGEAQATTMTPAILIAGPTASGKSALALDLAERLSGTVINADSMQVYRDLRLITARPTPADEARVPHRLYGHVDAASNYSVGRWCRDARAALDEVRGAGRLPILVGGTGLYFKALTQGLSAVPPTPPEIRAAMRARGEAEGTAALYDELTRRDPVMAARLRPGDRMRALRALEVLEATGRSLSDWHRDGMPAILDPETALKIFLDADRAVLGRRIDARFEAMLAAGALDEVRAFVARGLDPLLPAMKAHGVPWLRRHLAGEIGLAEAAEGGKSDTRRYTKRQVTWFRHQMPGWRWIAPASAKSIVLEAISNISA
jgi:tRNA dimethylallyltransferase